MIARIAIISFPVSKEQLRRFWQFWQLWQSSDASPHSRLEPGGGDAEARRFAQRRDAARRPAVAVGASARPSSRSSQILHLIDRLGIDTADIGLPGAGRTSSGDVERLAQEIAIAAPERQGRTARRARSSPTSSRSSRSRSGPACRSRRARSSGRARSGSTPRTGRSISCCGSPRRRSRSPSAKGCR